jgi:gamma-glutamylcyclotransferase (GGCT)/AIG2-like uncharacterized protein YtfP
MSDAPQFLFAYGTLMSGLDCAMGRPERVRLAGETRSLGAATVQGRLYELGSYPGFVMSDDPSERVAGEVLRIGDAAATLAWLDAYEGIGPARHDGDRAEADEYDRILVPARLAGGTLVSVWIYRYRGGLAGLRWLQDGRWAPAG